MSATNSLQAVALAEGYCFTPAPQMGFGSDRFKLTQECAADVLGDLVAGLGLGEVAELLVEHPLELKVEAYMREKSWD